jgi:hypothetical protein
METMIDIDKIEAAVKCEETAQDWGDVAEESGMKTCNKNQEP